MASASAAVLAAAASSSCFWIPAVRSRKLLRMIGPAFQARRREHDDRRHRARDELLERREDRIDRRVALVVEGDLLGARQEPTGGEGGSGEQAHADTPWFIASPTARCTTSSLGRRPVASSLRRRRHVGHGRFDLAASCLLGRIDLGCRSAALVGDAGIGRSDLLGALGFEGGACRLDRGSARRHGRPRVGPRSRPRRREPTWWTPAPSRGHPRSGRSAPSSRHAPCGTGTGASRAPAPRRHRSPRRLLSLRGRWG